MKSYKLKGSSISPLSFARSQHCCEWHHAERTLRRDTDYRDQQETTDIQDEEQLSKAHFPGCLLSLHFTFKFRCVAFKVIIKCLGCAVKRRSLFYFKFQIVLKTQISHDKKKVKLYFVLVAQRFQV